MKIHYTTIILFLGLQFLITGCKKEKQWVNLPEIPLVEGEYKAEMLDSAIVYHTSPYSAFTDLAFYEGNFYLTFRIAREHGFDTTSSIKTLRSKDFMRWSDFSTNRDKGLDVRDPKFLVDKEQLFLNYTTITNNVPINKKQLKLFAVNGLDKTILLRNDFTKNDIWYWYTGPLHGELLSMGYKDAKVNYYHMSQSKSPYLKCALDLPNHASEGRFVADKKNLYSVVRTKFKGILVISNLLNICAPTLFQLPIYQLGGPNITVFNADNLLISGRELIDNNNSGKNVKTSLFLFNTKLNTISKLMELPSFSDNGYAGHVVKNDIIYVSYYDHHVATGKSVIKTARIKIIKKNA